MAFINAWAGSQPIEEGMRRAHPVASEVGPGPKPKLEVANVAPLDVAALKKDLWSVEGQSLTVYQSSRSVASSARDVWKPSVYTVEMKESAKPKSDEKAPTIGFMQWDSASGQVHFFDPKGKPAASLDAQGRIMGKGGQEAPLNYEPKVIKDVETHPQTPDQGQGQLPVSISLGKHTTVSLLRYEGTKSPPRTLFNAVQVDTHHVDVVDNRRSYARDDSNGKLIDIGPRPNGSLLEIRAKDGDAVGKELRLD